MIVIVANEKGGVGKSVVAVHAAVRLAMTGHPTLLVDADPQGTGAAWAAARAKHLPDAHQVACRRLSGDFRAEVQQLAREFRHIVIDVGGADTAALRAGLAIAQRAIIPVQVRRRDLMVLQHMADLIQQFNERRKTPLKARVVFNQVSALPTIWPRVDEAREALNSMGLEAIEPVIKQRVAYDDSEYQGGTVFDSGNDPKAADEMEEVLRTLLRKEGQE